MANPLKIAGNDTDRIYPPKDEAERVRFWIDRGNGLLAENGRRDLEWKCVNGTYFIDPIR